MVETFSLTVKRFVPKAVSSEWFSDCLVQRRRLPARFLPVNGKLMGAECENTKGCCIAGGCICEKPWEFSLDRRKRRGLQSNSHGLGSAGEMEKGQDPSHERQTKLFFVLRTAREIRKSCERDGPQKKNNCERILRMTHHFLVLTEIG